VWGRYLPPFQIWARYPTNYLPLGRNASLPLRRGEGVKELMVQKKIIERVEARYEGRLMHLVASENTLSRFAGERHYSWVENYMEWLEGKEERPKYHALLEEELASLRG
jgi:hypothetical protein